MAAIGPSDAKRMAVQHLDSAARVMAIIYDDVDGDPRLMSRIIDTVERLGWRLESQSASESALAVPKMLGEAGHWVSHMDSAPHGTFTTHRVWQPGRQIMLPPEITRSRKVTLLFRNELLGLDPSEYPLPVQTAIAEVRADVAAERAAAEAHRAEERKKVLDQQRARELNSALRGAIWRKWRQWLPVGLAVLSPILVLIGALLPSVYFYYPRDPELFDFSGLAYSFNWRRSVGVASAILLAAVARRVIKKGSHRSLGSTLLTLVGAGAATVAALASIARVDNSWTEGGSRAVAKAANATLKAAGLLERETRVRGSDLVYLMFGQPLVLMGVAAAILGMFTWGGGRRAVGRPDDYELAKTTTYLAAHGQPLAPRVLGPALVLSWALAFMGAIFIFVVSVHPETNLGAAPGWVSIVGGIVGTAVTWRRGVAQEEVSLGAKPGSPVAPATVGRARLADDQARRMK